MNTQIRMRTICAARVAATAAILLATGAMAASLQVLQSDLAVLPFEGGGETITETSCEHVRATSCHERKVSQ